MFGKLDAWLRFKHPADCRIIDRSIILFPSRCTPESDQSDNVTMHAQPRIRLRQKREVKIDANRTADLEEIPIRYSDGANFGAVFVAADRMFSIGRDSKNSDFWSFIALFVSP